MIEIYTNFVIETWAVPYGWIYMIAAIGWNSVYWLYLVYLYCAKILWIWLEDYLAWAADIFGVSVTLSWWATEWTFRTSYWTLFYLFKWTVIGLQAFVEYFWDSIEWFYYWSIDAAQWLWEALGDFIVWSWETFVDFVEWCWQTFVIDFFTWLYQTFTNVIQFCIIMPSAIAARFIIIFDWSTFFAYKYVEFLASDYYSDYAYDKYVNFWKSMFWLGIYLMLWPVTFPITLIWFLFLWW